jgi:hypothetical protein
MEPITLYERFFPGAGARLAGGLPSLERVAAAFVDRLDLLVLRRSG